MSVPLGGGKTLSFTIVDVQAEYDYNQGDYQHGLLKIQDIYRNVIKKDPNTGDYNFGDLTAAYEQFPDGGAHWHKSVETFKDIHPVLKAVIKAALTPDPPLEIQWGWNEHATAPGNPNITKGVSVTYDSAANQYSVFIFGYVMPT